MRRIKKRSTSKAIRPVFLVPLNMRKHGSRQ
jgi:hypothetical protein